jgi:hypothetical protein
MRLLLSLILVAIAVAIRYALFASGTLYTADEAQWSNWIVAAITTLVAVVAISTQPGTTSADRVALISGARCDRRGSHRPRIAALAHHAA